MDTRADRNYNPGNIGYGNWAASHGATGAAGTDTGHGVAVFPSSQAGFDAMAELARGKYNNGKISAAQLISGNNGWTPGNYEAAANVARTLGIGPNDDLSLNDPAKMRAFQLALATQEGAPRLVANFRDGVGMTLPPGAATAPPLPSPPPLPSTAGQNFSWAQAGATLPPANTPRQSVGSMFPGAQGLDTTPIPLPAAPAGSGVQWQAPSPISPPAQPAGSGVQWPGASPRDAAPQPPTQPAGNPLAGFGDALAAIANGLLASQKNAANQPFREQPPAQSPAPTIGDLIRNGIISGPMNLT